MDIKEMEDHNPRFKSGDIVKVKGYTGMVFRVERHSQSLAIRFGESPYDLMYYLIHTSSRKRVVAFEDDMSHYKSPHEKSIENARRNQRRKDKIDRLLDKYNDYVTLYKMFGDEEYSRKSEEIIIKLNEMINSSSLKQNY